MQQEVHGNGVEFASVDDQSGHERTDGPASDRHPRVGDHEATDPNGHLAQGIEPWNASSSMRRPVGRVGVYDRDVSSGSMCSPDIDAGPGAAVPPFASRMAVPSARTAVATETATSTISR